MGSHRHVITPTEKGSRFEQWFILQCLSFVRSHHLPWRWYSYRTEQGAEVDLVLYLGERYLAIECKLGRNVRPGQLGGLRSFADIADKPTKSFVAYWGEQAQVMPDGSTAVPYLDFLLKTLPELAGKAVVAES